jgi:hypothetical protein
MFRSNDSFDRSFNTMGGIIKFMFIFVIGAMIVTFGYRAYRMSNGKTMYEITVPTYGNTTPTTYFASEYVERDGCIIFKDEFGFEHKVCGAYQVQKW